MTVQERINWLEQELLLDGRWKKWEPFALILVIPMLLLTLMSLALMIRDLFLPAENWASSGNFVFMTATGVLCTFELCRQVQLFRHRNRIKPFAMDETVINDDSAKVMRGRNRVGLLLISAVGIFSFIELMMEKWSDVPREFPLWDALQWPVFLGLFLGIAIMLAQAVKLGRVLKQFEQKIRN